MNTALGYQFTAKDTYNLTMQAKNSNMECRHGVYYDIKGNDALIILTRDSIIYKEFLIEKFANLTGTIIVKGCAKNGLTFKNFKCKKLDLSELDTALMSDMTKMFHFCEVPELDLSSFNTSNVNCMTHMFSYCKADKIILSSFNTLKVTNMDFMFAFSSVKNLDLSNFSYEKLNSAISMFTGTLYNFEDFKKVNDELC